MGNPLSQPPFPSSVCVFKAQPRVLGHYQASDFSAVHCPARALCIPVMIQCFVSRPNIIATLDNASPFWAWQTAAPLLAEHGPFVQCYPRMDRPTEQGVMHKATSVLPWVLQLHRAPCSMPAALGMPLRAKGPGMGLAGGSRETKGEKLSGEQRGEIPKTVLRNFRASLRCARGAAARGDLSALPGSSRGLHSWQ